MNIRFFNAFRNLLFPTKKNGYRAFILHPIPLIICLIASGLIISFIYLHLNQTSHILGTNTDLNESTILSLINIQRQKNNFAPLHPNPQLSKAAQAKGEDMLKNQYWAHISDQQTTPWQFILDSGYKFLYAGENLAKDFSDSQILVDAWMNSPSHKANILNSNYTETGIAIVDGPFLTEEHATLIIQMFATPLPPDLADSVIYTKEGIMEVYHQTSLLEFNPLHIDSWNIFLISLAGIAIISSLATAAIIDISIGRKLRQAHAPHPKYWRQ